MRILDIDLDFFLKDCCELAPLGQRPPLYGNAVWSEEETRAFLENALGLSKENKTPGRMFETHDKALVFWDELIKSGRLDIPFEVTHIDAHSDLGIGKPGPGFVLNSVITLAPEKRADIERYYRMNELDEANYLLFAIGFRWISSVDNVRIPRSRPDIPNFAVKNGAGEYSHIRLASFASKLLESKNGAEPPVAFRVYEDHTKFKSTGKYDYISVARSPRYAPKEADALFEIIGEYILPI